MNVGVGRHECRVERAFANNRPEVIGQPQRHEKHISKRTCAEDCSEHDVAREAGEPRKQRVAADGEDTTEHQPIPTVAAPCMEPKIIILRSEAIPAAQSWQVAKTAQKREDHARLRVYNPNTPTSWAAVSGDGLQRPQPSATFGFTLPSEVEVHT